MAVGISRRRGGYSPFRGPTLWQRAGMWLRQALAPAWPWVRVPLSVLALAHIVLVFLLPGGRSELLGVQAQGLPAYLSLFEVGDAEGYYTPGGRDGFLVYRIFTQEDEVVEASFPDTGVLPRLRYERWAAAGHVAAGPHPQLHAAALDYVLDSLPGQPVKLEMYAADWRWDRDELGYPWPGEALPEVERRLRPLGTYDGFTRTWQPAGATGQSQ